MKKFLFAILAGCSLLAAQANADALSILQNTRIKAQQTVSLSNLSNIFLTAARYLGDNRKYPTLSELNLPVRTLANPYHGLGAEQQIPDKITDANSGYAYFGAALNGTRRRRRPDHDSARIRKTVDPAGRKGGRTLRQRQGPGRRPEGRKLRRRHRGPEERGQESERGDLGQTRRRRQSD